MSRKVDPDDAGEMLWPNAREPDALTGPRVARVDTDSRKGGATRKTNWPYRRGLQEESDASSLPQNPPHWMGTDGSIPTKSSSSAHNHNYAGSRVGAVAGDAAETATDDLEIGKTHKSTGTESGMLPVSSSSDPYEPRVGAVPVEAVETGRDYDTVVLGDETDIEESPDAVVEVAFTQETWKSEVRDQLRSEIQQETQAQIYSHIVAAESVGSSLHHCSGEGATPPFSTRRKRMYLASAIVMVIIIGIVVGVLFATGTIGDDGGECAANPRADQRLEGQNIGDYFGFFVVLSSDSSTMAVGGRDGNYVQVFRWNSNKWDQIGKTLHGGEGKYGCSVALDHDGSVLAVGEYHNHSRGGKEAGMAQVWQYNDSEWNLIGTFEGDKMEDCLGWYVSLSSDGKTFAVSAHQKKSVKYPGYVRVLTYNGSQWAPLGHDLMGENIGDEFGRSIALSADGRRLAVGARHGAGDKGRVQVFDYSRGNWTQVGQNLDGDAFEDFWGSSIDLSTNGSIVAIGGDGANGTIFNGNNTGLVRVYRLNGTGKWVPMGQSLWGEGPEDHFGNNQIALSDNGDCLAAGSVHYNERGKGYLFQWNNSHWNEIASVTSECPESRLGEAATVSGNCSRYAFGSPNSESGDVYTYQMG